MAEKHRGARFALGGLTITLVFALAISPSASARELAPPPAGGGLVENPDGTWSLYAERASTPLKVYSSAEHQAFLELDAGLDLDTGTTGQEAGDVEGIDTDDVEEDHRMTLRLRTGNPYASEGEAYVGNGVIANDQALETLPENGAIFADCARDAEEACGFTAGPGPLLIGVEIGDGLGDLLGLPELSSSLGHGEERFAEMGGGRRNLQRTWEYMNAIRVKGSYAHSLPACDSSTYAEYKVHTLAGECDEVAVQWDWKGTWEYNYLEEKWRTESEEGTPAFQSIWEWPENPHVPEASPSACPSESWIICELKHSEGFEFGYEQTKLLLSLDASASQVAFPAAELGHDGTAAEALPALEKQPDISTPLKITTLPHIPTRVLIFIAYENAKGPLPGIEGPGVPNPYLLPGEPERFGLGSVAAPDRRGCFAGGPVNCATGNEVASETDLSVGGRGPALGLALTYNSGLALDQAQPDGAPPGPFGYGWTGSYSDHLEQGFDSREATVYQADGSTVSFVRSGEGWAATGVGVEATLAREGSGYVYTLPNQTTLHFNSAGQLTSEVDRNGNALTMSRNSEGRLEAIKDGAGREITLKYNSEGQVESASDPMGHTVKYTYEAGSLASVTLPGETIPRWQYKYNPWHGLTSETDGRGYATTTEYNAMGQVASQTDPLGRKRQWKYFATTTSTETAIIEPNGVTTIEMFNEYGSPTSVTKAVATSHPATTTDSYNSEDELTASTNPDEDTTEYGYDAAGDLTSEKNPDGDETKWEYDSTHDVTGITTPLGEKTTIERDSHGNAIKVSRPAPGETIQTTKYKYDSHGDVESMTDPLGHEWKYEYDGYGDRTAEIDPEGDKRTWGYNEDSQETSTVSPRGHASGAKESSFTTTIERDAQGRPTAIVNPLKDKTEYIYNADSDLATEIDPEGNKTTCTYDEDDEPTKVEVPSKATTETEYNSEGQVTAQTDGNKHTTKYERNPLGEVSEEINPLGQKTTKEYDKAGNLISVTDADKRTTTYKYDPAGRLIEVTYSDGKTPTVKYEYNADGTRTKMIDGTGESIYTYDQLQRLTETKDGHGDTVKYEYNLADNPTKITYPNGKSITRAYDNDERLKSVTDWLEHTTKFTYNPDSELSASTFPTGTSDEDIYAYDDSDAMSEVTMKKASETLASLAYTRDKDGGVTKATSKGLPGEEKPAFSYDENSRLTKGAGTKYAYDAANNPTAIGEDTYSYNSADELEKSTLKKATVATYAYNEVGQRTKTTPASGPATSYGYDQAGNLTTVTRAKEGEIPAIEDTYAYSGEGLRASQTVSGSTGYLTWDMAEALPLILNDGSYSYIYGPGDIPIEQISSSGTVTYLHHDQQGSTRLLTGETGKTEGSYSYSPYGVSEHSGTATTPLGYDAQYTSSDTGLIYMRARTYDPATAQFLSIDPAEALTWEPYGYAYDNPVNLVDPAGLEAIPLPAPVVGGCAAAPEVCGGVAVGGADVWLGAKVFNAWAGEEGGNDEGEAELRTKEAERENEEVCGEEPPRSLPYRGEPNSSAALDRGNGTGQIREYGPDGLPTRDFDFGHDHGFGDPHAHDWVEGLRGPGRPVEPNE